MSIVLVGLNHRTAPVEIRERLAFGESLICDALADLIDHDAVDEGLIVSTCNRVELVASSPTDPEKGAEKLSRFLCDFHSISSKSLESCLYHRQGPDAIKHVFRVASSLDSMVVGEPQILGQVKEAYQRAVQAGTIGRVLSKLMDRALAVAKRVRSETGVSQNPVSVSSVAVDLAGKIFGDLADKTVLLVGAGEMAELAARCLMNAGADRLVVTNRTAERAEAIAREFRGGAVSFEAFYDVLPAADIVICSTGAADFVIRQPEARRALKARRKGPILFIDISVPRNVDPDISNLENCFVFNVDDLESAVDANRRERHREAQAAEAIIETEVDEFLSHLRALDIGPSVTEVKQMLSEIALRELRRNRKHLGGITSDQEAAIRDVLIPALVNKLSHPIIVHLRAAARDGDRSSVTDELRKMIRLD